MYISTCTVYISCTHCRVIAYWLMFFVLHIRHEIKFILSYLILNKNVGIIFLLRHLTDGIINKGVTSLGSEESMASPLGYFDHAVNSIDLPSTTS